MLKKSHNFQGDGDAFNLKIIIRAIVIDFNIKILRKFYVTLL